MELDLLDLKNDYILPFKFKKLKNGRYFLVNDIGERVVITKEAFKKIISGEDIPESLETLLKEKNFLKDSNYDEKKIVKKLAGKWITRNHYMLHGPTLHIMVLTLSCNHSCQYCHASAEVDKSGKYNMSKDMAKKVVDVIFQTTSGTINIEFQGGEPLLNWEVLKEVVEYAREKNKQYNVNLYFSLVTNLSLMDEEKLQFLMSDDINISTSLDGPKEVHDKNRNLVGSSSFENVSYWIKRINQEYSSKSMQKQIGAIGTATKISLDYPKDIVDTYIEHGLEKIFMRPLNPYGFAAKVIDKIGYPESEYIDFYNKMLDYIDKKQKEGINIKDTYRDNICTTNLDSPKKVDYMEERSPCGAVIGQVAYNWDGGIYTCDEGRMLATMGDDNFKVGEINTEFSAEYIYKNMILNNVTQTMIESSFIDTLPGYDSNPISSFIGTCPIYSYTVSGNPYSKYQKESRFKLQENVIDNLVSNK